MSSRLEELTKRATENILFDMEFDKRMASGETITSIISVTYTNQGRVPLSTDINLGANSFLGTIAQIRITAGQIKEQYEIIFTVGTSALNTRVGSGILRIT